MAVEIIKVRKKNNHSLTRTIQKAALSIFERRGWEPVDESETVSVPLTSGAKKKAVEPAAAPVNETDPFEKVDDEKEEATDVSIESLRAEYENLSGAKVDKRWNAKRLTDEISKIKE